MRSLHTTAVLALALALVHAPRLLSDECCEYVSYDDPANFQHNPYIRQVTWSNVRWALTDGVILVRTHARSPPLVLSDCPHSQQR